MRLVSVALTETLSSRLSNFLRNVRTKCFEVFHNFITNKYRSAKYSLSNSIAYCDLTGRDRYPWAKNFEDLDCRNLMTAYDILILLHWKRPKDRKAWWCLGARSEEYGGCGTSWILSSPSFFKSVLLCVWSGVIHEGSFLVLGQSLRRISLLFSKVQNIPKRQGYWYPKNSFFSWSGCSGCGFDSTSKSTKCLTHSLLSQKQYSSSIVAMQSIHTNVRWRLRR